MAQALAEKLEHTGPAEKQRVASVPQRERERERAVGKYAKAAFAKRNRAVCSEYQIMGGERVKVGKRKRD